MCILTLFGTNSQSDFTIRDETSPLWIIEESNEVYKNILGTKDIYEATPSFDCGCFLYYGEWSQGEENHAGRVAAAMAFKQFLIRNQNDITEIVIFGDYQRWSREEFSMATLSLKDLDKDEFDLESETIYRLNLQSG